MRTHVRLHPGLTICFAMGLLSQAVAAPLGTAITYQGQLILSENPVDEPADLRFRLFDAASAGTQVGATVDLPSVAVSNGLFTVALDFGAGAFNGDARWLEVAARVPAGSGSYVTISPRQALTPAPYALFAKSAAKQMQCGTATTGADGTLSITFDEPFSATPAVTATAFSSAGGVVATLVSVTATGFTVKTTVPSATASSYTHTHDVSWAPMMPHTHCIPGELAHAHAIAADPHTHPTPAVAAHTHLYDRLSDILSGGAHTHMYNLVTAILGVTGGAPAEFDIFTGPPEEPCELVKAVTAYQQYPGYDFYPICLHTHKATINQVVEHTHGMELVEMPTSSAGNHGHSFTLVQTPSGAGGAIPAGATGAEVPAHSHGGASGAAGAHSHGGVTCAGNDLPPHDHDLTSDSHTHTVTVGPSPIGVAFSWIACGQ